MAQLRVRASNLRGVEVPPERAPSMIDEYLVLAVAASFAEGTTIMRGLKELRVKESDRLEATAAMLRVNGVRVEISGDDLIVEGMGHVPGEGLVATHMDHRIAMSALVMGLAAVKPVKVDDTASVVSAIQKVREVLLNFQRQFAADPPGAVLDGRDIGTVICPDADVKIFVVADPKVRARRRTLEARARGEDADEAAVLADILKRDERDQNPAVAPLKPARDAHLLDNNHLDIESGVRAAIDIVDAVRAGRQRV